MLMHFIAELGDPLQKNIDVAKIAGGSAQYTNILNCNGLMQVTII